MASLCKHDIRGFDISKNDWWCLLMEVCQYVTELECIVQYLSSQALAAIVPL